MLQLEVTATGAFLKKVVLFSLLVFICISTCRPVWIFLSLSLSRMIQLTYLERRSTNRGVLISMLNQWRLAFKHMCVHLKKNLQYFRDDSDAKTMKCKKGDQLTDTRTRIAFLFLFFRDPLLICCGKSASSGQIFKIFCCFLLSLAVEGRYLHWTLKSYNIRTCLNLQIATGMKSSYCFKIK